MQKDSPNKPIFDSSKRLLDAIASIGELKFQDKKQSDGAINKRKGYK